MAPPTTNIRLLLGGDSVQQKIAIDDIQHRRYSEGEVERLHFDASTGDTARAIDEVLSYSLFNPERIVILDHLENSPKPDLDLLLEYASHPRGDTPFLILSASEKETPAALLKLLDKKLIRTLPKTSKGEIQKMVHDRCAEQQVSFEKNAMAFYMELCGDQVDAALRELDKLLLWADEKGSITLELCQRLVQNEQDKDIWAITNAVGDKKTAQALESLDQLLSQGDDEIAITARLIATFRGIYHCKALAADKVPEKDWGKRPGQNAFSLRNNKSRSQRFSLNDLRQAISLLRQTDNSLKGGRPLPSSAHRRILLERLIVDLCQMK